MQPKDIAARRVRGQRVWGTPYGSVAEAFLRMGAFQSQEFGVAGWSIAQRTRRLDREAVMRAYDEGSILRTHALRPTWHFVSPPDIRWIQALTGPRVSASNAPRHRQLGIDAKLLMRTTKTIARALQGGNHLTRTEIAAVLKRARIDADGARLAYIVMAAELDAVICSGPMKGKQLTYALVDERATAARSFDREAALGELARRYFTSRGPATLKDFTWWSSLTLADARRGVEIAGGGLAHETIDGRTYWFDRARRASPKAPRFDLVQGYDELVVSYTQSRDVLTGSHMPYGLRQGRPLYLHFVLLDGRLIGHWKPRYEKGGLVVEAWFYRRLTGPESIALDEAAARFGRYAGISAMVRIAGRPGR
jgi:winged helix DNA-binding protein